MSGYHRYLLNPTMTEILFAVISELLVAIVLEEVVALETEGLKGENFRPLFYEKNQ
ncbi:MAG: hypothetical protein Q7R65_01680 [bacterium]|nr:hypothetical protein [bacterium]